MNNRLDDDLAGYKIKFFNYGEKKSLNRFQIFN